MHRLLDRGVVVSQRPGDYTLNSQKEHVLAFLESLVAPFVAGVWVSVAVCGCVWLCVGECGCVWVSVAVCG